MNQVIYTPGREFSHVFGLRLLKKADTKILDVALMFSHTIDTRLIRRYSSK